VLQFGGGAASHAPVATDDVVIFQFVDHAFVPPPVDGVAQFEFDDGLGHGADGDEDSGDAEHDEEGVEDARGVGEPVAVAHRGHGGEGEIEGVENGVSANQAETHGSDRERRSDRHQDIEKTLCEPAHRSVRTKYSE
jgi:hypothetical protein